VPNTQRGAPRPGLLAALEGVAYLLVALGDGQLLNFRVDAATGALSERKKLALGTKPAELRAFRSKRAPAPPAAADPACVSGWHRHGCALADGPAAPAA